MKKKLINRWEEEAEWRKKWEAIARWIFSSKEEADFDDTYYLKNGRLDFRGINLEVFLELENYTNLELFEIEQDSRGIIQNKRFENIDFSYAKLEGRLFERCKFHKCLFNYTNLRGIDDGKCEFVDCNFYKGTFNGFLGYGGSHYKNILFDSVGMHKISMLWPDFEDCIFKNCNLKNTDFGGAHFDRVKFIGMVSSVWFKGMVEAGPNNRYREELYERWNTIKPMDVDFSEAELEYITISDYCNLSKIKLPASGGYYLINDIVKVRKYVTKCREESNENCDEFFDILLKLELAVRDGEKMGLFCLNEINGKIKKYIDEEKEQELAFQIFNQMLVELENKGLIVD